MNNYINALYSKMHNTIYTEKKLLDFIKFAAVIDKLTPLGIEHDPENLEKLAVKLMRYFKSEGVDLVSISYDESLNESITNVLNILKGKLIVLQDPKTKTDLTPVKTLLLRNIIATDGEYVLDQEISLLNNDIIDSLTIDFNGINVLLSGINDSNKVLLLLKLISALHIFNVNHKKLTKQDLDTKYIELYNISHIIDALNNENLLQQCSGDAIKEVYKLLLTSTSDSATENYVTTLLNNNIGKGILNNPQLDYKNLRKKYNLDKESNLQTIIKEKGLNTYTNTVDIKNAINYKSDNHNLTSVLDYIVNNDVLPDNISERQKVIEDINKAITAAIQLAINSLGLKEEIIKNSYDAWKNSKINDQWTLMNFAQMLKRFDSEDPKYLQIIKIPVKNNDKQKISLKEQILTDAFNIATKSSQAPEIENPDQGNNQYINILIELTLLNNYDEKSLLNVFSKYSKEVKTSIQNATIDPDTLINKIFNSLLLITKIGLEDTSDTYYGFTSLLVFIEKMAQTSKSGNTAPAKKPAKMEILKK